jgi:HSP20 family protein
MRVLELPSGIDPSQIRATMSNGVLKITIPKPDKPQPKRIEVKEAS